MQHIHFIGIGGVGMNGLAQLAALHGFSVTGSDRSYLPGSEPFRSLENLGIRILSQDGSGVDQETTCAVYSTAIEADNPDLNRAQSQSIPCLHRADFLQELIGSDTLIAVSGTAGKSTVTGLLGWIFESLGRDPTVYNGAAVRNWQTGRSLGNVRKGASGLWIIEADESDRSFLTFHPDHAVITNISSDHFELDELNALFRQFESQVSGTVIKGAPDRSDPFTQAYCQDPHPHLIGRHNRANALCAARLCLELGMDMEQVHAAIRTFKGIERRLEVVGNACGVTVIDDYAHNPAKIKAAVTAVAETYPAVHAYWRPHGFTPLFQSQEELIDAFATACPDSLFILPVYYAGGTVRRLITSEQFATRLHSAGVHATYVPDYETLRRELEQCAGAGEAVLGMGARDPELPLFAKRLVAEWKHARP